MATYCAFCGCLSDGEHACCPVCGSDASWQFSVARETPGEYCVLPRPESEEAEHAAA